MKVEINQLPESGAAKFADQTAPLSEIPFTVKKRRYETMENSTPNASTATISEKALFAAFVESDITLNPDSEDKFFQTKVRNLFMGSALQLDLGWTMKALLDEALRSDDPLSVLEIAEEDLLGALHDIKMVRKQFFKKLLANREMPTDGAPRESEADEEGVDFIEAGDAPTPEPEFIDMTPADEAHIRGEIA